MTHIRYAMVMCLAFVAFLATPVYPTDSPGEKAAATEVQYRQAIEDARAGSTERALDALQSLVVQFPERQDILGDYVVVLGWAGDHASAIEYRDKIRRADALAYVIESLANSARRLRHLALAESLYRESMARFPVRVESLIGLALTLADAGKHGDATALIERRRDGKGNMLHVEVLADGARLPAANAETGPQ